MNAANLFRYEPVALGVLRIMAGLLFLAHGTQKFLSFPSGERAGIRLGFRQSGCVRRHHRIGLRDVDRARLVHPSGRIPGFGHDGRCLFHRLMRRRISGPSTIWATPPILYCFLFLYLVFRGPGALSVDGDRRPIEVGETEKL